MLKGSAAVVIDYSLEDMLILREPLLEVGGAFRIGVSRQKNANEE
jgi:hypothetical protein